MVETILGGEAKTPFLSFGDHVHIEMLDRDGRSLFGAIDQRVVAYERPSRETVERTA
jgi:fumarylacetoacetate (FAA) hydrolase